MNNQIDDGINISSSAGKRITAIQNTLINRTLMISLLFVVLTVALSLIRVFETGWQYAHIVHFIALISLFITVLFRKRISYSARYWIMMLLLITTALAGLTSYGLLGQGYSSLIIAAVLTSVFASERLSYLILFSGAVIIFIFMILFTNGFLKVSFDIEKYFLASSSWMSLFFSFLLWIGMLITVTSGLFRNLKALVEESSVRLNQIQELNATLEQKVESRTKNLAQSNQEKDRILGVVAHDINNKLVGILGYLSMLNEHYESLTDNDRLKYSEKAMQCGIFARDIVKELLEFTRVSNNDQTITTEPVNMFEFVQSTVECHLPGAIKKNIELKICTVSGHAFCKVNRAKLSRVVDNLVTNALKFTPNGGTVTVDIEKSTENVVICVSDTGIGIPDQLKTNIFVPFSSSGRPGTEKEESTGLGLSISREIVEQHRGKIWFESEEGKGSTFYLQLPVTAIEESDLAILNSAAVSDESREIPQKSFF